MNGVLQRLSPLLRRIEVLSKACASLQVRAVSTTNPCQLKEISFTKKDEGKTLVVEGVYVKSPREDYVIDHLKPSSLTTCEKQQTSSKGSQPCPLCKLGLEIKHTDVLILQQFLSPFGKLMQRRITGLCKTQQRRIGYLVRMADMAGILKTPMTEEPRRRPSFMKYNKYYDESVIDEFMARKRKKA